MIQTVAAWLLIYQWDDVISQTQWIYSFSIFAQVNINKSYKLIGQIRRIELLYSPTGEYNKIEIFKMAASRFVEVTDKEISEIKINSVPKKTLND